MFARLTVNRRHQRKTDRGPTMLFKARRSLLCLLFHTCSPILVPNPHDTPSRTRYRRDPAEQAAPSQEIRLTHTPNRVPERLPPVRSRTRTAVENDPAHRARVFGVLEHLGVGLADRAGGGERAAAEVLPDGERRAGGEPGERRVLDHGKYPVSAFFAARKRRMLTPVEFCWRRTEPSKPADMFLPLEYRGERQERGVRFYVSPLDRSYRVCLSQQLLWMTFDGKLTEGVANKEQRCACIGRERA